MEKFTVTLTFTNIEAENALSAASFVAHHFLYDPDSLTYNVMNEATKEVEDIEDLYDEDDEDFDDEDCEDEDEDQKIKYICMKQPQIRLKEKDGEELGVFPVYRVDWGKDGSLIYLEVEYLVLQYTSFYLSADKKTFVNGYGNIIGTLIDDSKNKFYNNNLNFDLEKISSYDEVDIEMDYDKNLVDKYIIRVNDNSYFYRERVDRNSDFDKLRKMFVGKMS